MAFERHHSTLIVASLITVASFVAATAHIPLEDFRTQFGHLIDSEPPRFDVDVHGERPHPAPAGEP